MCIHVLSVNWLLYTSIYISIYSIRIVVIPLSVHRHKYIYIYTDICIYCAYIYMYTCRYMVSTGYQACRPVIGICDSPAKDPPADG